MVVARGYPPTSLVRRSNVTPGQQESLRELIVRLILIFAVGISVIESRRERYGLGRGGRPPRVIRHAVHITLCATYIVLLVGFWRHLGFMPRILAFGFLGIEIVYLRLEWGFRKEA